MKKIMFLFLLFISTQIFSINLTGFNYQEALVYSAEHSGEILFQNGYLYSASNSKIEKFSVENNNLVLSDHIECGGFITNLCVFGDSLYFTDSFFNNEKKLFVVNIENDQMNVVNELSLINTAGNNVRCDNKYIFIGGSNSSLPVTVYNRRNFEYEGILSEINSMNFLITDSLVIDSKIIQSHSFLRIFQKSENFEYSFLSTLQLPNSNPCYHISIFSNYLFLSNFYTIDIIDISNLQQPIYITTINLQNISGDTPHKLKILDNNILVVNLRQKLQLYNIEDIQNPLYLTSYMYGNLIGDSFDGIEVINNKIFLAGRYSGINRLEINSDYMITIDETFGRSRDYLNYKLTSHYLLMNSMTNAFDYFEVNNSTQIDTLDSYNISFIPAFSDSIGIFCKYQNNSYNLVYFKFNNDIEIVNQESVSHPFDLMYIAPYYYATDLISKEISVFTLNDDYSRNIVSTKIFSFMPSILGFNENYVFIKVNNDIIVYERDVFPFEEFGNYSIQYLPGYSHFSTAKILNNEYAVFTFTDSGMSSVINVLYHFDINNLFDEISDFTANNLSLHNQVTEGNFISYDTFGKAYFFNINELPNFVPYNNFVFNIGTTNLFFDEDRNVCYSVSRQEVHKYGFDYTNNGSININPLNDYAMKNYPNPFNPTTTISFDLPKSANVDLSIYNIKGQKVKTLTSEKYPKGKHSLIWNGTNDKNQNVGSGVYFYKLKVGGENIAVSKCLLLK